MSLPTDGVLVPAVVDTGGPGAVPPVVDPRAACTRESTVAMMRGIVASNAACTDWSSIGCKDAAVVTDTEAAVREVPPGAVESVAEDAGVVVPVSGIGVSDPLVDAISFESC